MQDWPYPRIVAHRGGGSLAPENTLEAIDAGRALGLRMIEFDAKLAADDTVFLLHDDRVDRTSDGRGEAGAMSYAQLRALDAGHWFDARFAGARMPTLAEVAQRCASGRIAANIEIKPSAGRDADTGTRVARTAAREWAACRGDAALTPLLSSFSFVALEAAAHAAPDLPRGLLYREVPDDWRVQAAALSCKSLHARHTALTERRVADIKAAGLWILAYTVNDPEVARRLGAWGVDAICTDRIDLIGADFFAAAGAAGPES
ncbi:glycerophosphodiester phosphodiesterase [Robbsia betulipollinis]